MYFFTALLTLLLSLKHTLIVLYHDFCNIVYRQNVQPVLRKSRPRLYATPKRKYHQQSTIHESLNRYDPWKDIYQQGVFDRHVNKYPIRNTSSSSSLKSFTSHAPEKKDKGNVGAKGELLLKMD